jgi:two-component system, chemotaxis family, sensor kinase CheA
VELSQVLGLESRRLENWSNAFIVVCQVGSMKFGIVVDSVLQTEEIVVKPVSARIRHLTCYSGATILGDGSVIMILDPNGLVQHVGKVAEAHNDNAVDTDAAHLLANATSTLLVFRAGSGGPKAVPLAMVTRLEEIDVSKIEHTNGQRLLQYRGRLMRLIPCQHDVVLKETGSQPILVFSAGTTVVGLLVDEIIDIVEDQLDLGLGGTEPGVIGSAVIRGRATDIMDVSYFVPELAGHGATGTQVQRRLLLVEPSEFFRAMLGPVLQAAGFQLHQAGSAADAARHLGAGAFDVIVANVEDSGILAIANKAGAATLCIGLAGRASRQVLESAHQAGFNDVVGQFDREGLLASIGAGIASVGEAA